MVSLMGSTGKEPTLACLPTQQVPCLSSLVLLTLEWQRQEPRTVTHLGLVLSVSHVPPTSVTRLCYQSRKAAAMKEQWGAQYPSAPHKPHE